MNVLGQNSELVVSSAGEASDLYMVGRLVRISDGDSLFVDPGIDNAALVPPDLVI